eukprot:364702-Chlamydomonas_euryale.AAC.5
MHGPKRACVRSRQLGSAGADLQDDLGRTRNGFAKQPTCNRTFWWAPLSTGSPKVCGQASTVVRAPRSWRLRITTCCQPLRITTCCQPLRITTCCQPLRMTTCCQPVCDVSETYDTIEQNSFTGAQVGGPMQAVPSSPSGLLSKPWL